MNTMSCDACGRVIRDRGAYVSVGLNEAKERGLEPSYDLCPPCTRALLEPLFARVARKDK